MLGLLLSPQVHCNFHETYQALCDRPCDPDVGLLNYRVSKVLSALGKGCHPGGLNSQAPREGTFLIGSTGRRTMAKKVRFTGFYFSSAVASFQAFDGLSSTGRRPGEKKLEISFIYFELQLFWKVWSTVTQKLMLDRMWRKQMANLFDYIFNIIL